MRRAAILLVLAAMLVGAGTWPAPLRMAARLLVVDEPLQASDVLVVAIDAQQEGGVLEAADLFHQGIAPLVAIFGTAPTRAQRELQRRGVAYEDNADTAVRQLRALGARAERLPIAVTGTSDQGEALAAWCRQRGCRSATVITNAEHSRRLRRVLRRALTDAGIRPTIRVSRYMDYDVNRWWATRRGVHATVEEFAKLAVDILRNPLS